MVQLTPAGPRPVEDGLTFTVRGIPAPQGSKRPIRNAVTGRLVVVESSKRAKPWRDRVTDAAVEARGDRPTIEGAVRLVATFTFPRPASHFGKRGLRPAAPPWPSGRIGDLSKLVRAVEDSLTEAGVWRDDSRVVDLLAAKRWGDEPGVEIEVRELEAIVDA